MSSDSSLPKAIIIVDDEPDILEILQRLVQHLAAGFDVVTCSSGEQALDQFARWKVVLLITDVVLPGIQGYELTAAIKAQSPNTYVIMLSGGDTAELKQRGQEYDADACLPKPFVFATFLELVRSVMDKDGAV